MDLRNIESQTKIEDALDVIATRDGIERVSLLHQNGINVKSKPFSPDTPLNDIAQISSTIFSLTHKIHDHNWDYVILEFITGKILFVPLFFDVGNDNCPFFLQIVVHADSEVNSLLLNIQNSLSKIIKELLPINEEFQSTSQSALVLDEHLNFQGRNPTIGSILSNYFGPASSLDVESVDVYITDKSLNTVGIHESQTLGFNRYELNCVWSILSWAEKLTNILKKTTITSIRINYLTNFHFIYPLEIEKTIDQGNFLSIITKSQSKLGYWGILVPQINKKIKNSFNFT